MNETDLRRTVVAALRRYDDLEFLHSSPLAGLYAIEPLNGDDSSELIATHARGLAVRRFLDRAFDALEADNLDAARLLHDRYRRRQEVPELAKSRKLQVGGVKRQLGQALDAFMVHVTIIEHEAAKRGSGRLPRQSRHLPAIHTGEYVGLEAPLAELRAALRTARSRYGQIVLVTGLGGIGKSRLVTEGLIAWLREEARDIETVLWGEWESGPHEDLAEQWFALVRRLGRQLDIPLERLSSGERGMDALTERLAARAGRYVVVLDNIETPDELTLALERGSALARIVPLIVTSRTESERPGLSLHRLTGLEEPAAIALIRAEMRRLAHEPIPEAEAKRIVETIGGHPLSLKLAAAQLTRLPVEQVLTLLRSRSTVTDELFAHVYETSWQLLDPLARGLLIELLTLPPAGASWSALRDGLEEAGGEGAGERLADVINELIALNLIQVDTRDAAKPIYSLHPLTLRFLEWKTGL